MIGIILQARMGSTRMPKKILKPFYNGNSIIDIIVERASQLSGVRVIVATTTSPVDDPLVAHLKARHIAYYRGSESDVLGRYIETAKYYGVAKVIRVCADNPFLDIKALEVLVEYARQSSQDYLSFCVAGIPTIKTHYGFWAEYASLECLERVAGLTTESLYHEHVTNYIYTHPEEFSIQWLQLSYEKLLLNLPLRLTIDTEADFDLASTIYAEMIKECGAKFTVQQVIAHVTLHTDYLKLMQQQIALNSK